MKTLLTIIILVLTIFISALFVKKYFVYDTSSSVQKVVSSTSATSTPTDVIINTNTKTTTETTVIPSKPIDISSPAEKHSSSATTKHKKKKLAGIDVDKLVSVASSQGLKAKVLKSALNAYVWALDNGKLGKNKDTLTVVDFTLPSYERRMWVLNLYQNKVLMKLHTTQGAGSGLVYANHFSNISRSQATSIGLYTTSEKYYGKHGMSMRLNGLQKGINNNARSRAIVIHEATYATPAYIRANHRAGRSWGCFAVDPASKNRLLNYVQGGSAFFAYANSIEKTPIISHGPISI